MDANKSLRNRDVTAFNSSILPLHPVFQAGQQCRFTSKPVWWSLAMFAVSTRKIIIIASCWWFYSLHIWLVWLKHVPHMVPHIISLKIEMLLVFCRYRLKSFRKCRLVSFVDLHLAQIQVFRRRGSTKWGRHSRESGDIFPRKIFKFPVLGNTISANLRQSQRVLITHFLN